MFEQNFEKFLDQFCMLIENGSSNGPTRSCRRITNISQIEEIFDIFIEEDILDCVNLLRANRLLEAYNHPGWCHFDELKKSKPVPRLDKDSLKWIEHGKRFKEVLRNVSNILQIDLSSPPKLSWDCPNDKWKHVGPVCKESALKKYLKSKKHYKKHDPEPLHSCMYRKYGPKSIHVKYTALIESGIEDVLLILTEDQNAGVWNSHISSVDIYPPGVHSPDAPGGAHCKLVYEHLTTLFKSINIHTVFEAFIVDALNEPGSRSFMVLTHTPGFSQPPESLHGSFTDPSKVPQDQSENVFDELKLPTDVGWSLLHPKKVMRAPVEGSLLRLRPIADNKGVFNRCILEFNVIANVGIPADGAFFKLAVPFLCSNMLAVGAAVQKKGVEHWKERVVSEKGAVSLREDIYSMWVKRRVDECAESLMKTTKRDSIFCSLSSNV
eukprot:GHVR01166001.1.p1 GENE.GHVR01166001.1~~GHVR01166001.1.p1  ORF type:complete len:437 (+),score=29.01 GHVR01166001.1:7-1317(+)